MNAASALAAATPKPSTERSKNHQSKNDVMATNTNRW